MKNELFILNKAYATETYVQIASMSAGEGAFYDVGTSALFSDVYTGHTNFQFTAKEANGLLKSSVVIPNAGVVKTTKAYPTCSGTGLMITYTGGAGGVGIVTPVLVTGGTGYKVGDYVTVENSGGTLHPKILITAVSAVGEVTALALEYAGTGTYVVANVAAGLPALAYDNRVLGHGCVVNITSDAVAGGTITNPVITGAEITTAGTGYKVGDVVALNKANVTAFATYTVTDVNSTGGITSMAQVEIGAGYGNAAAVTATALFSTNFSKQIILTPTVVPILGNEYTLRITNNLTKEVEEQTVVSTSAVIATLITQLAALTFTDVTLTDGTTYLGVTGKDIYTEVFAELSGTVEDDDYARVCVKTTITPATYEKGTQAKIIEMFKDMSVSDGETNDPRYKNLMTNIPSGIEDASYLVYSMQWAKDTNSSMQSDEGRKDKGMLFIALRGDVTVASASFDTVLGV